MTKLMEQVSINKWTQDFIKDVEQYIQTEIYKKFKLAQINLDNQEIDLENALKNTQDKEQSFLDGITKKYGQGTLNPETGVFTPVETTENKSE